MRRLRNAARKKELLRPQMGDGNPRVDRVPRLLGDLKLNRALGFLLHNDRAGGDMAALHHVLHAKSDQIAPAQLAVNRKIEQREFPVSMIQL
jgi:hypothetical protein